MNLVEPIDIRTGKPFDSRRQHLHHRPSIDGACIEGNWGRARGLTGGAFMGAMLAAQGGTPPPYDYRVEYLQSDGASYIDTGIVMSNDCGIKMVSEITQQDTSFSNLCLFGSRTSSGDTRIVVGYNVSSASNGVRPYIGWNTLVLSADTSYLMYVGQSYTVQVNYMQSRTAEDGTGRSAALRSELASQDRNALLFAADQYNGIVHCYSRVREAWMSRGADVIRHFVPCVSNGIPCMYDDVGDTMYYNQGTGTFTAGPRIN